jgi:Cof subfamily protein (haloacid dehalogenase superfamily)
MKQPLLVVTDVDGTLLDPFEVLSPRTEAAVRAVSAAGVPFVLASGRPPRWLPKVSERLELSGYAVCANGAVIYDLATDRVIHATALDAVLLRDAADELRQVLPGCAVAVERIGMTGAELGDQHFLAEPGYQHAWPCPDYQSVSTAEVLGHSAVKMLVRHERMRSAPMALVAREALSDEVDITYSTDSGLIELSRRGVSKASGLAAVAELYGVTPDDVIAFGDMPNDIPMLAWARHGVAMANAHPQVLEIADEVTASNCEDGVALVLERWFHDARG